MVTLFPAKKGKYKIDRRLLRTVPFLLPFQILTRIVFLIVKLENTKVKEGEKEIIPIVINR